MPLFAIVGFSKIHRKLQQAVSVQHIPCNISSTNYQDVLSYFSCGHCKQHNLFCYMFIYVNTQKVDVNFKTRLIQLHCKRSVFYPHP